MATNLIDTVKSFFTPDVVNRASARLGESEDGIRRAVDGGVPVVFAGLLQRADHGGAPSLLSDARQAATHHLPGPPEVLFTSSSADLSTTGNGWGVALFGGAFSVISNALASFAGIKTGSAHTMLNMLTPLSLSVVGYQAEEENLNDQGLRALLDEQRPSIMAAQPAGLNVGRLMTEEHHGPITVVTGHVPLTAERPLRVVPYTIWWVLIVIAVLALIAYFISG
jgi:hypothetical protein